MITALLVVMVAGAAANPTPLELMTQADKRHRVSGERTRVTITLQAKDKPDRVRTLIMAVAQDPKGKVGDKQWMRFETPGDVKGTQLLTIEGTDGGVEQWLYLPAFKKTRRIGAAELSDQFANTDFSYEDLKRRRVEDYAYTMVGSEPIDGADCWVIEAVPSSERAKKESSYSKSRLFLRKDILFVVQMRHSDKNGRPAKMWRAENLVKAQGTAWRAEKLTMVDIQKSRQTVVVFNAREVLGTLPDATFDMRTLAER